VRFDIRYTSRFAYPGPVSESQNELRACPAADGRQQVVHYRVVTTPSARLDSYVDYWGTRVDTFGIRAPHVSLEVLAEATVETSPAPVVAASPRLADLEDPAFRDEHREFLGRSTHVDWGADVAAEAERAAALAGDDAVGAALSLHRTTGNRVSYRAGETYVGVPVDEVYEAGRGVCQDYAHLLVAMCRSRGLPARYVSGYLFTTDDATGADADDDEVEVQTGTTTTSPRSAASTSDPRTTS
jgi:transglutaminase-like putative cysteine protease